MRPHKHRGFSFIRILQRCPEFQANRWEPCMQDPHSVLILTHENGVTILTDVGSCLQEPSGTRSLRPRGGETHRRHERDAYRLGSSTGIRTCPATRTCAMPDRMYTPETSRAAWRKSWINSPFGRETDHERHNAGNDQFSSDRKAGVDDTANGPGPDTCPALLMPYRQLSELRYDFPLVLIDNPASPAFADSLTGICNRLLRDIAPEGNAGEQLRQHVLRLEKRMRELVADGHEESLSSYGSAPKSHCSRTARRPRRSLAQQSRDGSIRAQSDGRRWSTVMLDLPAHSAACIQRG